MSLSKDEAAQALKEIGEATNRSQTLTGYSGGAPYALMWGAIWLVANCATQYDYKVGQIAWAAGIFTAVVVSLILSIVQSRRRATQDLSAQARERNRRNGWRFGATAALSWFFLLAVFSVLAPLSYRQFNAGISLIWMFAYMGLGIWIGWRLFVIGAVAAAAILFGYFRLEHYFDLWMGIVGGGALILGGLWLRKV